jgi:glycine betaine/choline ABC-type transport system substrate-binding protein
MTTPKQQFTTLRKEIYKSNIGRLEMLREMEEKEKTVAGYVVDKFAEKTNLENISKLSKVALPFKR